MAESTTPQAPANWNAVIEGRLPTSSRTILLVEDETFVREVACEVLRAAGYEVIPAKNAAEATHCYERRGCQVDLLLTDVVLPDQNGCMLAKALREKTPALKALFVTGYAKQMDRRLGSDELLPKPFSKDLLVEKVNRILDRECLLRK
ncbi:MAG TPA: response regulator [Candidatus Solibacter sp.]|nr:response regulator [Candidatus Solibacter sp.]